VGLTPARLALALSANAARIGLSLLLAAMLLGIGMAGMFVSAAPRWVSLLLEPLSLLLMPGLLVAILVAGAHDFGPVVVVVGSAVFYTALVYTALGRWKARRLNS
jgi:hypothetical protein